MKILFKRMLWSCYSFREYEKIILEPGKKAVFYFFLVVLISSALIYPKYFNQKVKILSPVLESISKEFPVLQFKGYELVSSIGGHLVINNLFLSIVIDPLASLKQDVFTGPWLLFTKTNLQFNYSSEQQIFAYNNPFISVLFNELAGFQNGTGRLDGTFFLKLQEVFQKAYLINGILFVLNFIIISIVFNFVFSLVGQFYSKLINTSLQWKDVRVISSYAITPVLIALITAYYLDLPVLRLQPVFILAYMLFLSAAIHRFKVPIEEKADEDFF